ncbi:hypothetical protein [Kitasatospora sp. NPDC088346]|uniref:hypothetical protein n=1 Tax=Kitasatospora sp. NPDC088346 TaxID=3364073 RepID=UPI00380FDDBC
MRDETVPGGGVDRFWSEVDPLILGGRRVPALIRIRETFGVGIRDGIDLLGERYETLQRERPGDFTVGRDGYWDGFHS